MLDTTSVASTYRPGPRFGPDLDETPIVARRTDGEHTLHLHQMPPQTQDALRRRLADEAEVAGEWSEAAVVQLHWVLLAELKKLCDPDTPLEEKIDTLDWALSPAGEHIPFSFAACVRVVGTSPLSPSAYFGRVDVDELRDWIRVHARRWLRETLARYPLWARELFYRDPQSAAARLSANPQWLNEQIRRHEVSMSSTCVQPDLFAAAAAFTHPLQAAPCATN